MHKNIARSMAVVLVAGFILLGAGCAAQDDIDKARIEAKEAKGASDRAEEAANEAESAASQAARTAEDAMNVANQGQECCTANSDRIDRAAKRAMSN